MYFIGALRTLKKFYNKYVIYVFRLFFGTQYTRVYAKFKLRSQKKC